MNDRTGTPLHDPWHTPEDEFAEDLDPKIPDILSRLHERMPVTEDERRLLERYRQQGRQDCGPEEDGWLSADNDPCPDAIQLNGTQDWEKNSAEAEETRGPKICPSSSDDWSWP